MPDSANKPADSGGPEGTSLTLLQRLRANEDQAWRQFHELYGPLMRYWCGREGLPASDVDDVLQEVFQGVMKNLTGFRKERPGDTFRGWLRTVTRNYVRLHFRRADRHAAAAGGTKALRALQDVADVKSVSDDDEDPADQLRDLYQRAVEFIRGEFEDRTWQAFRQVVIDGRRPADVAADLGVTSAAVRMAKSRVLRRVKQEVGDLVD